MTVDPLLSAKYERLVISCIRKVMRRYGAAFNEEDVEDLVSATALNIVKHYVPNPIG